MKAEVHRMKVTIEDSQTGETTQISTDMLWILYTCGDRGVKDRIHQFTHGICSAIEAVGAASIMMKEIVPECISKAKGILNNFYEDHPELSESEKKGIHDALFGVQFDQEVDDEHS